MKRLIIPLAAGAVLALVVGVLMVVVRAASPLYSTDVVVTPDKETGQYQVEVRVTRLAAERGPFGGKPMSKGIRMTAPFGQMASSFSGRTDPGLEGVTAEMFCPKPGESDFAFCTVTVNRGKKVVSTANFRFWVEGN